MCTYLSIKIDDYNPKKKKRKEKKRKLQDLNARIDAAPEGNPLANQAKKIEIKLDQMAEEKTKGLYCQKPSAMV